MGLPILPVVESPTAPSSLPPSKEPSASALEKGKAIVEEPPLFPIQGETMAPGVVKKSWKRMARGVLKDISNVGLVGPPPSNKRVVPSDGNVDSGLAVKLLKSDMLDVMMDTVDDSVILAAVGSQPGQIL